MHCRQIIPISIATMLLCAGILASPALAARQSGDFTYDIFRNGDSIGFWIDLTPVLSQAQMEDLLAGLAIYIGIEIRLESPRPFFFSRLITRKRAALILSHGLTEDLYKIELVGGPPLQRQFDNQMQIRDFMADSVEFSLAATNAMDTGNKYRISASLSSKSYSSKEIVRQSHSPSDSSGPSNESGTEFFESLFSTFIELTGFGRDTFHVITPNFTIKDITPSVP